MDVNEQLKGLPVNVYNWDSVLERWVAAADINQNPLIKYMISDEDSDADPSYYGFLDTEGNWYIMEESEAFGTFRYVRGTVGNYAAAWAARAGLVYQVYNLVF